MIRMSLAGGHVDWRPGDNARHPWSRWRQVPPPLPPPCFSLLTLIQENIFLAEGNDSQTKHNECQLLVRFHPLHTYVFGRLRIRMYTSLQVDDSYISVSAG